MQGNFKNLAEVGRDILTLCLQAESQQRACARAHTQPHTHTVFVIKRWFKSLFLVVAAFETV